MRQALVLGGTGTIGQKILKNLAEANIRTYFTYYRAEKMAQTLANQFSQEAFLLNLENPQELRILIQKLAQEGKTPDIFIQTVAIHENLPFAKIGDLDWLRLQTINCHSFFAGCQALAPKMIEQKNGDIIILSALNRTQSIKLPVHFAATQGTLSAMIMALSKELGANGIRANMVCSGLLNEGLSSTLSPQLREDYQKFSALRRFGTPEEIANFVIWLALKNSYINGQVLSVNGGI